MKILFYIGSLKKGGAERVISNLANDFVKNNEVVLITTVNKIEYSLNRNIIYHSLEYKKKTNIMQQLKNLKKLVNKENPDVIISFLTGANFRILLLRKMINIPIIISVRNDPKKEYKALQRKILSKILYPKTDGIVFQTEEAKKYFNRKIQNKSVIIPNPIKKEFFTNEQSTSKKEKIIVSVGRLEKQKNHNLLIDAFFDISKKFPDYKLIIYGEGSLRKQLEKKIQSLNMQDKVILPGIVDNIQDKIKQAKVFVMSSDYEGMPNALMEAMALGLIVISTDCPCGGPKFLIENNKNGFLVGVKNMKELSTAIEKALKLSEKEIKKISENARKFVSKLNEEEINKIWYEYIEKVVHNY